MQAVVLESIGPAATSLVLHPQYPVPQPQSGQVLIRVRAIGLNHSELMVRLGEPNPMGAIPLPRVLGIECVGTIASPGSQNELREGTVVMAALGGMGMRFDGSYAEYCVASEENVIPIAKSEAEVRLPWELLGALPEMLQTAHGCLFRALKVQKEERVLIRGGTSGVGKMAMALAKRAGCKVLVTTREPTREAMLKEAGADHVVVDRQGKIKDAVLEIHADGVDKVLELVGAATVIDSLQCLAPGGVCCSAGTLGGKWAVDHFLPSFQIPLGRYLTGYAVTTFKKENAAWDEVLGMFEKGELKVEMGKVYHGLEKVIEAHEVMEKDKAGGKIVVLL